MMKRFEIDLPNTGPYLDMQATFRRSDSYDAQQSTDQIAEFLECLYEQLPQVVTERLARDSRLNDFRRSLSDRL